MTEHMVPKTIAIRELLRMQTHDAHERLHEHASFAALQNGTIAMADYRQLMRHLHGFYAALDQAMMRTRAPQGAAYHYVSRSDVLCQDLTDLKFSDEEIDQNPRCTQVFDIVSPSTIGGVIYVIEGATLGGTVIDQAARRILPGPDPAGRRYWGWCKSVSKHRWAMARKHIDEMANHGTSLEDLSTGASDTFRILADWLAPLNTSPPVSAGAEP